MSELDWLDKLILQHLQRRGRVSNADLAEEVNLSASACHRRMQRLEKSGVIRDYVALLDPRKVDRRATVFVEITLSGQSDDTLDGFEKAVALAAEKYCSSSIMLEKGGVEITHSFEVENIHGAAFKRGAAANMSSRNQAAKVCLPSTPDFAYTVDAC